MRWKKNIPDRNSNIGQVTWPVIDPTRPSDAELLRSVGRGSESAFLTLVERYADHLFGLAFSLTANAADAEDVVQETFTAMLKGSTGFRHEASVKTWLVRIAVKQSALAKRRRAREKVIPMNQNSVPAAPEAEGLAVNSAATAVDASVDVMHMLQTLSEEHRQVIVLRELEGMSYDEMAHTLGVPQGTVESRLHRARRELRERYREYLQ